MSKEIEDAVARRLHGVSVATENCGGLEQMLYEQFALTADDLAREETIRFLVVADVSVEKNENTGELYYLFVVTDTSLPE